MEIKCFSNASNSLSSNDVIILDTSMMIALSSQTHVNYSNAISFTDEVAKADAIMTITIKQQEELFIKFTNDLGDGTNRKRNLSSTSNLGQRISNQVEYTGYLLEMNELFINQPQGVIDLEVMKRAQELLANYNVEWGDAVTAAIAEQLAVNSIASCDLDYTRIKDSPVIKKIYLPDYLYNKYLKENPV